MPLWCAPTESATPTQVVKSASARHRPRASSPRLTSAAFTRSQVFVSANLAVSDGHGLLKIFIAGNLSNHEGGEVGTSQLMSRLFSFSR